MGSSWVQKLCHLHSWRWWYPFNSPQRDTNHDFVLGFVGKHRKQEQISWESLQRQQKKNGRSSPEVHSHGGGAQLGFRRMFCGVLMSAQPCKAHSSPPLCCSWEFQVRVPQPGLFAQSLCFAGCQGSAQTASAAQARRDGCFTERWSCTPHGFGKLKCPEILGKCTRSLQSARTTFPGGKGHV